MSLKLGLNTRLVNWNTVILSIMNRRKVKQKNAPYSQAVIREALLILTELNGNLNATAKRVNVDRATIMRWRDKYGDNVEELATDEFKLQISEPDFREEVLKPYIDKKKSQVLKILEERDEWIEVIKMFREQLHEKNILNQDPKKLSEVAKILHEIGTGEDLDDKNKKGNNFWTVINQQILNQDNHEENN